MILNVEKYLPLVEHFDLTAKQKEELIRTVWGVMESYVDRAFGLHPVQKCLEQKEKNHLREEVLSLESKDNNH